MNLRESVLAALKEGRGEWISGGALGERFQVSRTAIWKQINALAAEGYEIESSRRHGYRIKAQADLLSAEEVCPGLTTKVLGRKDYFYYREIDSTNNRARQLASEGYPEGTVVVAEMQTAGRGRRGRSWYSPTRQGVYLSLILRPVLPMKEISRISLLTAVAVVEALESELQLQARIKWPNDILIDGKKIAGILSEAVTDMDGIEYVVVGIGLNINNQLGNFPAEIRNIATSALVESHHSASRIKVLQSLLRHLELRYQQLLEGNFADTLDKGKRLSVVIGRKVRLDTVNGCIMGQAIDIDDNGFLLVQEPSGKIETVMSGEINIVTASEQ